MATTFQGLAAAPGIGIGTITLFRHGQFALEGMEDAGHYDPNREWRLFREALGQVDVELERLGSTDNPLVAEIFSAHRVILQDRTLLDAIHTAIFEQNASAITATHQVVTELADLFRSFEDEYFSGRSADVLDIGQRLLARLGAPVSDPQLAHLPENTVLIAGDLNPSTLTQLPKGHVLGIALARSTPTAHSAILARSMGIPMVCTLGPDILNLTPGRQAVVHGHRGLLLTELTAQEMNELTEQRHIELVQQDSAQQHADTMAVTQDGVIVPVYANANSPEEVSQSTAAGADGIGLLRTEYLFRSRILPPTYGEQAKAYTEFIQQTRGQLTLRALDIGGDKPVEFIAHQREENPFLGLRGTRLLIEKPELLATQYRALQAAAQSSDNNIEVRFMLPMISTMEEVTAVHQLIAAIPTDLPSLPIGIMIEVPSAALLAPVLSPHVDFFSIGTNDLAQYVLAATAQIALLRVADPLHPSVLHLIKITCDAARMADKPVSLCGEIAGDAAAVPLLLGLGVTELSAPLPAVPTVKETIRACNLNQCRELALEALRCQSATAVRALLAAHSIH